MATIRKIWTNFSKGELSPLVEGRPDLAAYYEGCRQIENFFLLRQGGLQRRPGLRFIKEVKDSTKDTILLPFEATVDNAHVIEVGDDYMRFYTDKARIDSGGSAVEVVSPYQEADLRNVHYTQSVDVMYLFNQLYPQRALLNTAPGSFALNQIVFYPGPTFADDIDISLGATLTPGATSGSGVTFTASANRFMTSDVGRFIIYGASRGLITAVGGSPSNTCTVTIYDAFPNTNPIPSGDWLMRLAPQTTLDVNVKGPVSAAVNMVLSADGWRSNDVGRFLILYGGIIQIGVVTDAQNAIGTIFAELTEASANPAPIAAGSWSMEVAAWSADNGYPATGEFYQGRLGQANTPVQPTTFWLSAPDEYTVYAATGLADGAVIFTLASRQLNEIEWLADNIHLFLETAGSELRVQSERNGEPLGGDVVPLIEKIDTYGGAPIQPIVVSRKIISVDRSRTKILSTSYTIDEDGFDVIELTAAADHITGTGVRLGPLAFQKRRDPRIYFVREDGELITLTYFHKEKVIGFTRLVTDGLFEAVACIPGPVGESDQVWVIVRRTINGQTKRFVEMFENHHEDLTRDWTALHTDCAVVYAGVATTTITGLSHLEGETVDVIADGVYIGQKTVTAGQVTLEDAASEVEVGLHYDSEAETMRPAIEGQVIEGSRRSWNKLKARLHESYGGKINDELIPYSVGTIGQIDLHTGDVEATGQEWSEDGAVNIKQHLPYPFTVLAVFGELKIEGF